MTGVNAVAAGAKIFLGGRKQTESTGDLVQAPWSFFLSSSERLVNGYFLFKNLQSLRPKDNLKQAN